MTDDVQHVYVQPMWQRVRRKDVAAQYCRDRWCVRFVRPTDAVRISLETAQAAGFHPCRRCWKEDAE